MAYNRILCLLVVFLLLFSGCGSSPSKKTSDESSVTLPAFKDYTGVISSTAIEDVYVAVNSDREIVKYTQAGTLQSVLYTANVKLNDIASNQSGIVVVGQQGMIHYSVDGSIFETLVMDGSPNLLSVAPDNERFMIGCSDGNLIQLSLANGLATANILETQMGEPITSISCGNDRVIGICTTGKILSIDPSGTQTIRSITDFYSGDFSLCDSIFTGSEHWLLGRDESLGVVNLFVSDVGTMWSRRTVDHLEGERAAFDPPLIGYSLAWDGVQGVISCNEGRIISLPSCSECNIMTTVGAADLYTISSNGKSLFIAGEEGFTKTDQTAASKETNLDIAIANEYLSGGGVLIDVRSNEEYQNDSISGSINIPFASLEKELVKQIPDKNTCLIFTCAVGVRSAAAVEKARDLGYINSYSIGAFTNWNK